MWHNNVTVTRTYSSYNSQNAYASISGLGWRRIRTGATDGVTNLFVMMNAARANNRPVSVYIVNNLIERATLQ